MRTNRLSEGSLKGRLGLLLLLAVVVGALLLVSGCVQAVNGTTVVHDTGLGKVSVTQGAESWTTTQTLTEYGVFYSTNHDDVAKVDSTGGTGVHPNLAIIVSDPAVKQVSLRTNEIVSPSSNVSRTVNLKNLAPGTTYYVRGYVIGHDASGYIFNSLCAVTSHKTADPTLKSLTKSVGSLSPKFSKTTTVYKVTLSSSQGSTKIIVKPTVGGAVVKERIGNSGSWQVNVASWTVSVGRHSSKVLNIQVTSGGVTLSYSVTVKRN